MACKTAHVCFHGQKRVHTRLFKKNRTQRLTRRNRGCFGWGRYYYPRSVPHVHKHPRCTLPLLGFGRGCSRRTQRAFGTAMRLCASLFRRRRGPAGLRNLFRFCRNRDLYIRRSWFSACARWGWYYYPRRALRASETPDGRLQKRLTCRFLVSPIYICERPRRALPLSASIQIACHSISCGQTACPWLMQA